MAVFINDKRFLEEEFVKEEDFEQAVFNNHKIFFGKSTILINAKRKIETKSATGAIPDGFLFDLSEPNNPEFYLIEVELATHDFYNHIFPQVTKFFAFFKNAKSQSELVEKIYAIVNNDDTLKKEFKRLIGEKEIYKFLKDVVESSQNILLIVDGDISELPEIIETYSDTWGKIVRPLIIKRYSHSGESLYVMNPDFEDIEFVNTELVREEGSTISEEYHLDGINKDVKTIYDTLKKELLSINRELIFNPQKYYISVVHDKNVAFFKIRKKKVRLIVMLPEEVIRTQLKKHSVKSLSNSVQRFYNGLCAAVDIETSESLKEVVDLLIPLVKG